MTSVVRFEEWQEPTGTTAATVDGSGNVSLSGDLSVSGSVTSTGNPQGLTFVSQTTVGSSVSSITINNCFDGSFDNYRVVISGMAASTAGGQTIRLRFGSGNSTEYWGGGQSVLYSGTVNTWSFNNADQLDLAYLDTQPSRLSIVMDILTPYDTGTATPVHSRGTGLLSGTWVGGMYAPVARVTGMYFWPTSGTLTGGSVRIYGYGQ